MSIAHREYRKLSRQYTRMSVAVIDSARSMQEDSGGDGSGSVLRGAKVFSARGSTPNATGVQAIPQGQSMSRVGARSGLAPRSVPRLPRVDEGAEGSEGEGSPRSSRPIYLALPPTSRLQDELDTIHVKLEAAQRVAIQEATSSSLLCCCDGCGDGCGCSDGNRGLGGFIARHVASVHAVLRDTGVMLQTSHPLLLRWGLKVPLGIIGAILFYLDIACDVIVAEQLYADPSTIFWAQLSVSFIALQYFACHVTVCRYVARTRHGLPGASCTVWVISLLGYPLVPLILDVLMFLEPLTMSGVLWACMPPALAEELILFLPRYRRARPLLEITYEGVPQSALEVFIFLRLNVFAGYGVCADINRSHFNYDIDRTVLERSLLLTAIALAKAAVEYYFNDDDDDGPGGGGLAHYLGVVLRLGVRPALPGHDPAFLPSDPPLERLLREPDALERGAAAGGGGGGSLALGQHVVLNRSPSRSAMVDAAAAQLVFVNAVGALVV